MNPLELPDPNTWSLELARESAVSFPSFTVWSFTESRASRRDGRALKREQRRLTVTLRFRPHKDVRGDPAGGGMLRLSVPDAYAVARKSDGACEDFFLQDLTAMVLFNAGSDVTCTAGGTR
eukprot:g29782.t1